MDWEDLEIDFWLDFLKIKEDEEPEDMELELSMEEDWLDEWLRDGAEEEERHLWRKKLQKKKVRQTDRLGGGSG